MINNLVYKVFGPLTNPAITFLLKESVLDEIYYAKIYKQVEQNIQNHPNYEYLHSFGKHFKISLDERIKPIENEIHESNQFYNNLYKICAITSLVASLYFPFIAFPLTFLFCSLTCLSYFHLSENEKKLSCLLAQKILFNKTIVELTDILNLNDDTNPISEIGKVVLPYFLMENYKEIGIIPPDQLKVIYNENPTTKRDLFIKFNQRVPGGTEEPPIDESA